MATCVSMSDAMPPNRGQGKIQLIFGPMFSGKTTELIRRMKRYQIANYSCLIVKYAKDDRYDKDGIATHDKQTLQATVSASRLTPDVLELAARHEVVGVDEGQFFPDVVTFCEQLADQGVVVIVAALDGTYQRCGFGDILQLVPLAESVIKLTAVCMVCFGEAAFTKRKGHEKEVEVIGGQDKYLSVCRECYRSPAKASSPRQRVLGASNTRVAEHSTKKHRLSFNGADGGENCAPPAALHSSPDMEQR